MSQSVVIYWPTTEANATSAEIKALQEHFKLPTCMECSVTSLRFATTFKSTNHLVITPKHAHRAAQAAGALYMGREFALKKAGLLK